MPKMSMPSRSHHAAPRFDGKSSSLSLFLDDVEYLAKTCGLSKKETIKWAIRYSPSIDRELWEMQESVETGNWERFKEEVYDLYPGSKGENRYSLATLQAFINRQSSFTIQEAEDYGTYYRSFSKISSYLKNQSRLSDREIGIYFLQGLEPSFRLKVQTQLKAEDPKHHTDNPHTLSEISAAALFVLSSNHAEFRRREVPSISINQENLDLSQERSDLIIEAIVAAITDRQPKMELQQFRGRKEDNRTTRMNKQQDIRSKKDPEVSDLKKSDSKVISTPQYYRYITPINDTNLTRKSPDRAITIPAQSRVHNAELQSILAIKIQDSSQLQDTKPLPISKENVLVLTNTTQESSKDYDILASHFHLSQAPQKVETPEMPREVIPRTTNSQERKYLSSNKEDLFPWPDPAQRFADSRHDSQSTDSKENKTAFNIFLPENVSTIKSKSSILKNSTVPVTSNRINKPTQANMDSQTYLQQTYNLLAFRDPVTFKNGDIPLTIKQCAKSSISKARNYMISLFLESDQTKLAGQIQGHRTLQLREIIPTFVMKLTQIS